MMTMVEQLKAARFGVLIIIRQIETRWDAETYAVEESCYDVPTVTISGVTNTIRRDFIFKLFEELKGMDMPVELELFNSTAIFKFRYDI